MITKLTLKNFRCFDDFTLDGIRPVTLIAGGNNVGKSTLLESIYLFMARNLSNVFMKLNNFRGISEVSQSPMMLWEPLFSDMDANKDIEISVNIGDNDKQVLVIGKDKFFSLLSVSGVSLPKEIGVPIPNGYSLRLNYTDSAENIILNLTLTENNLVGYSNKPIIASKYCVSYLSSKLNFTPPQIAELFSKIELVGQKAQCIEILKALDQRIRDLSVAVIDGISGVYVDIGLTSKLPVNMLGDGINKLLYIALVMLANPNSIILIDEIENGFHHSFYPKLWDIVGELAVETKCQVFATTHSYECIGDAVTLAADENNPDFFRFVRLDRENGKIVPKVYGNSPFVNALNGRWEVR